MQLTRQTLSSDYGEQHLFYQYVTYDILLSCTAGVTLKNGNSYTRNKIYH